MKIRNKKHKNTLLNIFLQRNELSLKVFTVKVTTQTNALFEKLIEKSNPFDTRDFMLLAIYEALGYNAEPFMLEETFRDAKILLPNETLLEDSDFTSDEFQQYFQTRGSSQPLATISGKIPIPTKDLTKINELIRIGLNDKQKHARFNSLSFRNYIAKFIIHWHNKEMPHEKIGTA